MIKRSFLEILRSDLDVALEQHIKAFQQEDGAQSHSKGGEMVLLLALSKVQRNLQVERNLRLDDAGSSNLRRGAFSDLEDKENTSLEDFGGPCLSDLQGLATTLVSILVCESNYVCHSAGKALIEVLYYLNEEPAWWTSVPHILWSALKAWLRDSESDNFAGQEWFSGEAAIPVYPLACSRHFRQQNWVASMRALNVLHTILRNCKEEGTSQLKTFITISALHIGDVVAAFIADFLQVNSATMKQKSEGQLALGALLQFLCSIVHCMSLHSEMIKAVDCNTDCRILNSAQSFMSAFASHCLSPINRSCVYHYVRHKFMMLMFRLREWFIEKPSLVLTCLDILKSQLDDHFGSLFQRRAEFMSPLLGSPFSPHLVQKSELKKAGRPPIYQPERHAVFLVFKVVVSLKRISHHGTIEDQYAAQMETWMLNWLILHITAVGDFSRLGITEAADYLASSFVQIFVDEDSIMLEMLLLLLDIPTLDAFCILRDTAEEPLKVAHSLLVETFKPLRLFAVFLSMICYDHSVILDFLISKDTSTFCIRYLLRCLRVIHNTWPEFLSLSQTSSDKECRADKSYMLETIRKTQADSQEGKPLLMLDTNLDMQKAANCLLSLKLAVQRLHQKHVFPYNPSALLRHLDLFQELWWL